MTNEQAIYFEDVSYTAHGTAILKQITGSFYKGKITTLIGPSGAGKTTLLKMCNGLLSASTGSIFIDGRDIDTYEPTSLRRHVGMALQSAPLLRTTVFENLALPRKLQQQTLSTEEASYFLNAVGLDHSFLTRPAADLSGGQKQKLSIARTLINKSSILLLDEITSALDPKSVHEIEELIIKINREFGTTIIWITHNIEQAKQIGQFTWLMKDGKLIERGETKLVFSSPNTVVQQFLSGGDGA